MKKKKYKDSWLIQKVKRRIYSVLVQYDKIRGGRVGVGFSQSTNPALNAITESTLTEKENDV